MCHDEAPQSHGNALYTLSPKEEQGSKHRARADNKGMVAPRARKWESGEHNGLHHTECT